MKYVIRFVVGLFALAVIGVAVAGVFLGVGTFVAEVIAGNPRCFLAYSSVRRICISCG